MEQKLDFPGNLLNTTSRNNKRRDWNSVHYCPFLKADRPIYCCRSHWFTNLTLSKLTLTGAALIVTAILLIPFLRHLRFNHYEELFPGNDSHDKLMNNSIVYNDHDSIFIFYWQWSCIWICICNYMGFYWKMEKDNSSNVASDSSVFTANFVKHIYAVAPTYFCLEINKLKNKSLRTTSVSFKMYCGKIERRSEFREKDYF